MPPKLPYLATPGSITNALSKVKAAAKPPRFTNDFVQTKLQIKGGTGQQIAPYLKKIGLVGSDGTPTPLYDSYRNNATSGNAIAKAIKHGYAPLYEVNEYAHELSDQDLRSLIISVTGLDEDDRVVGLMHSTLLKLKELADFETDEPIDPPTNDSADNTFTDQKNSSPTASSTPSHSLGLSYTINLNLPATTNAEVFNAIFKSLKENLLVDRK